MSRASWSRSWRQWLALGLTLLSCPFAARAVDYKLKFEPGAAISLGNPQADRFNLGGAATLKGLIGVEGGILDVAAGLTFLGLPSEARFPASSGGTAWAPSLGLRLQLPRESEAARLARPHAPETLYGAKPWLDGDFMYVATGGLERVGFATAAGLAFPVGESRSFWFGPFVRYFQIIQPDTVGFDNRDARTLIFGLSLEAGTRVGAGAAPEPAQARVAVVAPADRDGDGITDDVDACPDVKGVASNAGCPEKVVAAPVVTELHESIPFAWSNSMIDPSAWPKLDALVQALQDKKDYRVDIEGHASSEGIHHENHSLSTSRAEAVRQYMVNEGVAPDRIFVQGFSSHRPVQANDTEAGRSANRRADVLVHLTMVKEGSAR